MQVVNSIDRGVPEALAGYQLRVPPRGPAPRPRRCQPLVRRASPPPWRPPCWARPRCSWALRGLAASKNSSSVSVCCSPHESGPKPGPGAGSHRGYSPHRQGLGPPPPAHARHVGGRRGVDAIDAPGAGVGAAGPRAKSSLSLFRAGSWEGPHHFRCRSRHSCSSKAKWKQPRMDVLAEARYP
jgi:hypothetical protein